MPGCAGSWIGSTGEPGWAWKEGAIARSNDLDRTAKPGPEALARLEAAKKALASRRADPASPAPAAGNGSRDALPGDTPGLPVARRRSPVRADGAAGGGAGHQGPAALLGELESAVTGFLEAARAGGALPLAALEGLASRLVDALAGGDDLVIRALDGGQRQESLAAHCVHVAIFAVRIAAGMGLDRSEQEQVALAALVHDVGMARLLPDLTHPRRILTAREQQELERHPEEGFKVLSALGPAYTWLADVAHQEHEREDGSGYPRGLVGGAIGEIARIVALADIYESLTHPRPHQEAVVPFDAVREILTSQRGRFSEPALRGLMMGLSAFPVGSLVRLSTREVARVVAANPASPLRPVVEVLCDAAGDRVEGRRIDLAKSGLLHIVDSATADEAL